ncbi:zinc ribbon domain-containing protein [Salinarimonas soli]|uniref:Zinc ribbon domain-containing protein n=1 Tax=Salinarimonas soli TaxID=1638099 RepID=A0A5B2VDL1_9HYPH|nr:zinc ribbon domain-containing protein [Salinarimonas soli]KAA2236429.1 zinc ribbon domain-containing protein [Salinarimonas soli]
MGKIAKGIGGLVGLVVFVNLFSPADKGSSTASTSAAKAVDEAVTVGSFRWSKEAFGSVMEASFVISNRNNFPIKDAKITCIHYAPSGTAIDSNTRVIYDRVQAGGSLAVSNFNMGFIHSQATRSRCEVEDYRRA